MTGVDREGRRTVSGGRRDTGGPENGGSGDSGDGGRIGKEFYDRTDYFEEGAEHLTDLQSDFQRYRIEKVLAIYEPGPEERVLDLGCGWGTFGFALAHRVREIVGVDFSEKSVALCEERLAAADLDNLRFVCADAADTGLEAESFDVVLAADLFEHLYPDQSVAVLEEVRRVLVRGGRLVVWTPHRGHVLEVLKNNRILLKPDPSHVDYKSMERLRELVADAGFVVEKAYYAESHLPGLSDVERLLIPWVPLLRRRIALLARKR